MGAAEDESAEVLSDRPAEVRQVPSSSGDAAAAAGAGEVEAASGVPVSCIFELTCAAVGASGTAAAAGGLGEHDTAA